MLSARQNQLKSQHLPVASIVTDKPIQKTTNSNLIIRNLQSEYDIDRVIELWANLSMIQSLHGHSHWTDRLKSSKLKWVDFIKLVLSQGTNKIIVFDDGAKIFGFSFMVMSEMDTKEATATIKEIYMEPSHQAQAKELSVQMQDLIKEMGAKYVEFDVIDL